MKHKHKFKKIMQVVRRQIIFTLSPLSHHRYMIRYNKYLREIGVNMVGKAKFIAPDAYLDGTNNYSLITLGDGVVISREVTVITHDFSIEVGLEALGLATKRDAKIVKPVEIGDHSFIGAKSLLLPGAKIGKYCIVGGGTVVPGKTYPDYSIICGNPGKIVGDVRESTQRKIGDGAKIVR